MNILRESMTRAITMDFSVRVWREEAIDAEVDHRHLESIIQGLNLVGDTPIEFAKRLIGMSNVNAVEVLDKRGNGTVLYRDWP